MREGIAKAVVAMGSNIERERNLPEAIRLLRRAPHITVERVSRFYESPSVGGPEDAPDFFNAAALICTELGPLELRAALRQIERESSAANEPTIRMHHEPSISTWPTSVRPSWMSTDGFSRTPWRERLLTSRYPSRRSLRIGYIQTTAALRKK